MGCFSKIWSRYSLKPSYIRECLRVKCREYGSHLPDIRPRGDADYVVVGRWMIARRLAVLAAGFLGLGSLWVILACLPARSDRAADGVSTYRYNALPLRFKSGRVAILGKSGYLAYEGEVEDGAANGTGVLYAPDGDVVYRGGFSQNQYSGFGERYYPGNLLWYAGDFAANEFEGEGTLYRKSGVVEYEGGFAGGLKEGRGVLYDGSGKQIYEGSFQKDRIVYEELAGRTASEMAAIYTGSRILYISEQDNCVFMPGISAVYRAHSGEKTVDGVWTVDGVYVLEQSIWLDGSLLEEIPRISAAVGPAVYEGNTCLAMPDAVAVNQAAGRQEAEAHRVRMETTPLFEDCMQVDGYDEGYLMYLYRFDTEDYLYTFFCTEKNGGFSCYLIEGKEM